MCEPTQVATRSLPDEGWYVNILWEVCSKMPENATEVLVLQALKQEGKSLRRSGMGRGKGKLDDV